MCLADRMCYLCTKGKTRDRKLGQHELMRYRIIEYINKHEGVEWVTFEQMCDEFKSKNQPPEGAVMPAAPGSILKE